MNNQIDLAASASDPNRGIAVSSRLILIADQRLSPE